MSLMFSLMQMVCNFLYQITFERILKIAKLYLSLHAPFPCERKLVVDLNIIYSKDLSIKKQQNVFTNVETNLKHIFNQACNFKEMEFFWQTRKEKNLRENSQANHKVKFRRTIGTRNPACYRQSLLMRNFHVVRPVSIHLISRRDNNALLMSVIFKSHKSGILFTLFSTINFKGSYCYILSLQRIPYSTSNKYRNIT